MDETVHCFLCHQLLAVTRTSYGARTSAHECPKQPGVETFFTAIRDELGWVKEVRMKK